MGLVDIIIIAAVLGAVIVALRSVVAKTKGGSCASCGDASSCTRTETGCCHAANEMVEHARQQFE